MRRVLIVNKQAFHIDCGSELALPGAALAAAPSCPAAAPPDSKFPARLACLSADNATVLLHERASDPPSGDKQLELMAQAMASRKQT
jgi:hypothetical protein